MWLVQSVRRGVSARSSEGGFSSDRIRKCGGFVLSRDHLNHDGVVVSYAGDEDGMSLPPDRRSGYHVSTHRCAAEVCSTAVRCNTTLVVYL